MDNSLQQEQPGHLNVISKTNWFLTLCVLSIPFAGLGLCLYWCISQNTHPTKRNFAAAYLIFTVVIYALGFFLTIWILSKIPDIDISTSSGIIVHEAPGTAL